VRSANISRDWGDGAAQFPGENWSTYGRSSRAPGEITRRVLTMQCSFLDATPHHLDPRPTCSMLACAATSWQSDAGRSRPSLAQFFGTASIVRLSRGGGGHRPTCGFDRGCRARPQVAATPSVIPDPWRFDQSLPNDVRPALARCPAACCGVRTAPVELKHLRFG